MSAAEGRVGLDTSVVLRLLVGEPVAQAQRATAFFDDLIENGGSPMVSDQVISEVYFAVQYHYRVPKTEALRALHQFLTGGEVVCTGVSAEVIDMKNLAAAKPGFVDRIIHAQYLQEAADAGMVTFEKAAKKLPKVVVL